MALTADDNIYVARDGTFIHGINSYARQRYSRYSSVGGGMARSRKAATAPRPSGPAGGSAWPAACQSSSLRGAKQLATSSPIVAGFISSVAHRQCSVGISSGGEASRSRCRRGSYGLGTAPALMTASFRGGCARQRRRQFGQGAHA